MCFYNDYDWYAELVVNHEEESPKDCKCMECGEPIAKGEWRRYVYQQEHEECLRCEWEELTPDEEPCDQHDYGETYEYWRCENCDKILRAIEAVERDEGCPPDELQPYLEELQESLHELVVYGDGIDHYRQRAYSMFPETRGVKWFAELLRKEKGNT